MEDLTLRLKKPVKASDRAHLDPDLTAESLEREPNWRPLFGQAEAAQRHLERQGVGLGDIFLFFGWFRQVEQRDGRFRFRPGSPDLHMLFGWLEVGEIWQLPRDAGLIPSWAANHPHVSATWPRNTIYAAAQATGGYAAGTFSSAGNDLILTRSGESRSKWRLPKWFHPSERKSTLSYHSNSSRWGEDNHHAHLQSVGRGQEFVLDTREYPEARSWAKALIRNHRAS